MTTTATYTDRIDEDTKIRVRSTCREAMHSAIEILYIVELLNDKIERDGYWERAFIVAWMDERQSCTHRVVINENEGECMWGHYFMGDDGTQAIADLKDRV